MDIVGYVNDGSHNYSFYAYRNDLGSKKWIKVRPVAAAGNKGAAGAKIRIYAAGTPGSTTLLWYEQVMIGNHYSYYSFPQTERHFGLGDRTMVDVSVEFYPSGKKVEQKGVKADATVVIAEP